MIAILANIFAAVTGAVLKIASSRAAQIAFEVAFWTVKKAFIVGIVFVGIPILVYNFILRFAADGLTYGLSFIDQSGLASNALVMEFTGMGGYIASQIGLPSLFAMFMTAVWVRFCLNVVRL